MDSPVASSFNPHKHLKEEFVSNLSGSSMFEIFLLSAAVPLIVVLRRAIGLHFVKGSNAWRSVKKTDGDVVSANAVPYIGTLLVDFLFIVVPLLLIHTILADWMQAVAVSLVLLVLLIIFFKRFNSSWTSVDLQTNNSIRTSISSYRVMTMIVTFLCILAVDFNVFPRRYAKTETYGTSWMDLGVGMFVLANALVSRQARNVSPGLKRWKSSILSTSPLILLGLGRLISTTGVDYQVHASEYGVHWNFFFTLAAVCILTSTINIHPKYSGILGVLILAVYQVCLLQGLNVYLLSKERGKDIISQNKEGIFSIFDQASCCNERGSLESLECCLTFLCNMGYVTLVFAVNFQALAILMLSEHMPGSKFTLLEDAINQNLLATFVVANVLTGLVNLSMDTLSASPLKSMITLVIYPFTLCFLTGAAHFYGVRM
ncbi:hypothetical protein V2J09_020346 [Rumex salicifolius]